MDKNNWNWIVEEYLKYRLELNISHTDLSLATDMPRSTIDRIEKLQRCPSIETMQRLLNSLGYSLSIVKIEDVEDFGQKQQLIDYYSSVNEILVERSKNKKSKKDDIRIMDYISQTSSLISNE